MTAPHVLPFPEPRDEERHFLSPPILAALKREASTSGASDWANYAQAKLDRELHACSLLLTNEQAEMLHRYAEVLGAQPQDVVAALLAPEAVERQEERRFKPWYASRSNAGASSRASRLPRVKWGWISTKCGAGTAGIAI